MASSMSANVCRHSPEASRMSRCSSSEISSLPPFWRSRRTTQTAVGLARLLTPIASPACVTGTCGRRCGQLVTSQRRSGDIRCQESSDRPTREESMTSAQSGAGPAGAGPAPDGPENDQTPCADCDPGLLDHLKCRAAGIQAQADYNKEHEADLTKARADFDGARSAYGAARSAAQPDVDDLRKQLAQLID